MQHILSGDAEIFYDVAGSGPPVFLLHPFPLDHAFWQAVAQSFSTRYQLIMPDLRGHGESALGQGPATMPKHAEDLRRLMDETGATRAPMVGVSIGGYILFEFWRRFRERVSGLVLCNTKAAADSPEARSARLSSAEDVLGRGTEPFFEGMLQKAPAESTRRSRPDLIEAVRRMMRKMSPEDVAGVQRGMAERPDSIATLKTIIVPTLIITGDEDVLTGVPEAEVMKQNIPGAGMKIISKAGHYSPLEQPQEVGRVLRQFLDSFYR
jgi:pimeloyl-ACP methyl ester carboxylesterase